MIEDIKRFRQLAADLGAPEALRTLQVAGQWMRMKISPEFAAQLAAYGHTPQTWSQGWPRQNTES